MNDSTRLVPGRLGLGMVGCGRFGEFCLTAFATIPSLALIGVTDRDQRRAEATAGAFGVAAYSDYMALLADPRVEVVAINTPPALHASMTIAAA
ncbi:MAG: Gfo/Idh/MocA family oxidoreductase, partial [Candidatus Dormibacteraeota bacterium]|nr:Gfo/Idh/MocA family oxidoreductase [Candidatus Dormibacteraeota bacterium]